MSCRTKSSGRHDQAQQNVISKEPWPGIRVQDRDDHFGDDPKMVLDGDDKIKDEH